LRLSAEFALTLGAAALRIGRHLSRLAITKRRTLTEQVSEPTTNRLSLYVWFLDTLEASGQETVSSGRIAERLNLNAAQIRKDLAHFGEFGVRGVGYDVKELKAHLRRILGLHLRLRVAVIGAGNLGLALADYQGFREDGFRIVALFDREPSKIGRQSRSGVRIHDIRMLRRMARRPGIDIAMIAVPASAAQSVAERVVAAGIKAILNFSPGALDVPPTVKVKGVDLTVSLESLSFYLARSDDSRG
jgi:redox-sensing transcriptional repressor